MTTGYERHALLVARARARLQRDWRRRLLQLLELRAADLDAQEIAAAWLDDPALDAILGVVTDNADAALERLEIWSFDSDVGGELEPDDVVGTDRRTGLPTTLRKLERAWTDPWELKLAASARRYHRRRLLEQLTAGELERGGPGGRALRRERLRRARAPFARLLFLRWAWLSAEPQHRRGMVSGSAVQTARLERESAERAMQQLRITEARRTRDRVEWWQWLVESLRGLCDVCSSDPDDAPHWRVKGHGANRD